MAEIELKELNRECVEAPELLVARAEDEYHRRISRISSQLSTMRSITEHPLMQVWHPVLTVW